MSEASSPVQLRRPGDRRVELTPLQRRIVAGDRLVPGEPIANMGHRYVVRAALDPDRFVDAVDRVVASTEVLRLVVDPTDPVGREHGDAWVVTRPPSRTAVVDLPLDDVERWSAERIARPLDPTTGVYDSVLLRHGDDTWSWWMCIHHVATDAASAGLVAAAVFAEYDGEPSPIDESYFDADLVRAACADDRRRDLETDLGAPLAWYGPIGERTAEATTYRLDAADDWRTSLAERLDGDLRSISRELGLLAVAASACAVLANRIEGRDELVVGVPLHHRGTRTARRIAGPLMEIHALRLGVDGDEPFRAVFDRALRSVMDLLRSASPGSAPDRGAELVLNVVRRGELSVAGVEVDDHWVRPGRIEPSTMFRLHLVDRPDPGGGRRLDLELDENRAFRDPGQTAGPAEHLSRVLDAVTRDPDVQVADIDLLTPQELEEHRALTPAPNARSHLGVAPVEIARRWAAAPERIVAEDHAGELTAGGADRWASAVADVLADDGVRRGDRVGLRVRRSSGVLAAVAGIHRVGASFVMLAPGDPDHRVEAICADAGITVVLDDERVDSLRPDARVTGSPTGEHSAAAVDRWAPRIGLDDEAYVLYTSGSTGVPKGVPISHRGLADYLAFAVEEYVGAGPPVVALHSELVFDLTITSVFLGPLTGGLTVVVDGTPIDALATVAADDRITFLKATPSQLELYLRLEPTAARSLDHIVVGGEAFRRPLAERLAEVCRPDVQIVNEYGPTEAVVGCMIHRWDPDLDTGPDVPIGVAANGSQLLVLDHAGRPAPVGSWGELWVRRPGMAQSYLGLPALSDERFVELPDDVVAPLVPRTGGEDPDRGQPPRWYRTGDRVRVERPGALVYGGRQDDQLKVRGIRLEPGEVESALVEHPLVEHATVRVWQPASLGSPPPDRRCVRCGLGTDVPGVVLVDGVCSVCRDYERVAPQAEQWFRTEADLDRELAEVRRRHDGDIDCLHLLSGGKDSTYALYQLVRRGWRVHALTLDNGFISDGAKENIRRTIDDLGITHEFATTPVMNEIFRDSLDRHANVCQGCYKTIYTIAVARARAMNIPVIVTGLSRGQFFETRLVPHQFEADRFDPEAIDATVLEARKVYHHTDDAVTRLLPEQAVFDDADVFDRVSFLDFYRYVDVDLADLYAFLDEHAPWVRPADTGRSTNCLINVAGIHVHRSERGYHNYAEPYSWDVRLGHKTRDEALEELDDPMDPDEIAALLRAVDYEPKPVELLTAWYRSVDDVDLDPDVLRAHLRERVPEHAVPTAFVRISEVPLAGGTKVDVAALPTPVRVTRSSADVVEASTDLERRLCRLWREVLGVEQVGVTDDFFDLGGASLAALSVVAAIDAEYGTDLPDAAVFRARTVRELAAVVERHRGDPTETEPIGRLDPGAPPPRSDGEEAMLFEYRMDPSTPRYIVSRRYRITPDADGGAPVDVDELIESVRDVVMVHEPLHVLHDEHRTRLDRAHAVGVFDVGRLTGAEMDRLAERLAHVTFDLDRGPLVRVHHAVTDDGDIALLIGVHHIGIDAGTFDVFWEQIARRYREGTVARPPVTYAEHTSWQRSRRDVVHAEDERFWRRKAQERAHVTASPFARPMPVEPDGYERRTIDVAPDRLGAPGATAFSRSMAAVAMTLAGAIGRPHVEFGVPSSTNDHPDASEVVGYYLNTLPVALTAPPTSTVSEVVDAATAGIAEVVAHRRYPLAQMVRDARSSGAIEPQVGFMLAYQELATPTLDGATVEQRILAAGASVADCTFFVQEREASVEIGIEWRGSVLGAADARRLFDAFERALVAAADTPASTVAEATGWDPEVDLVGPEPAAEVADGMVVVPARIVDRLAADPAGLAVIDGDGPLSNGDLVVAAAGLADRLDELLVSAPPGRPTSASRVVVEVERSASILVAQLAAWSVGASYVPIDPTAPPRRRQRIREAARPGVVLVDAGVAPLAATDEVTRPLERPRRGASDEEIDHSLQRLRDRMGRLDPTGEAYAIFTSGSTGRPKGVGVSHSNLAASTLVRAQVFPRAPRRFLVTSSIGFDSSMVGLVWPLLTGGTVVLPDDSTAGDLDRLAALIGDAVVSHVLMVPSLYRMLLLRHPRRLAGLDTVILAGESVGSSLVDEHHRTLPGVDLVNEYGPTEATVWVTSDRLVAGEEPAIGRPIPGVTTRVVTPDGEPVTVGAAGELIVSGPTVTAGYLDDPELTAQRFPSISGRTWYRTGDLVRVRHRVDAEPALLFLGRVDQQLNVGGNRLEPTEVESALEAIADIGEAVVVAAGDPPRLVAHVVLTPGRSFDEAALRRALAEELPARSVPTRFVVHDDLPRTVHGKVDRTALTLASGRAPAPDAEVVTTTRREENAVVADAPHDGGAELVRSVWSDALGRDDLTIESDFFESGGDSLSAVVIVTELGARLGHDVPIAHLLVGRTPRGMAALLDLDDDAGSDGSGSGDPRTGLGDGVTLVTMRSAPDDAPLIVLTPAWDEIFGYQALADAVPDGIGVVALTIDPTADVPDARTVPGYARRAHHLVRELVEGRPTAVVGWSIGGLGAAELVALLAASGRAPAFLSLIDTYFPGEQRRLWSNRWSKYRSMVRPGGGRAILREIGVTARRRLRPMAVLTGRRLLRWAGVEAEPAVAVPQRSVGVPPEIFDHPIDRLDAPLLFVQASTTNPARSIDHWRRVAAEIEVVTVDGRHRGFDSIMQAGRVERIADAIARRLRAES